MDFTFIKIVRRYLEKAKDNRGRNSGMKFQKVSNIAKVKTYYLRVFDHGLAQTAATLFDNDFFVQPQTNGLKRIKYNRKCHVYQLKFENDLYYLKKFISPTLIFKMKNAIRLSKAVASMRKAWKLLERNFEVAEPVAALTYQRTIFHKESLYITKNYPGTTLREFLNSNVTIETKKRALWDFSTLLGDFYKCGYFHSDPNPGNFMIKEDNGKYRFAFIDLEAIHHYPWVSDICTFRSLKKLYFKAHFDERFLNRAELRLLLKNFLSIYKPTADFSRILRYLKL
jgi:serine/threonine protein kinase